MAAEGVIGFGRAALRRWRVWLGLAISLLFLAFVARQVSDISAVGDQLAGANYLWVLPALAAYFAGVWLRAARWHYLLRPLRPVPTERLFPVVVIGYMANDVLPARLGEFVRAYVLGEREQISKSTTLATIAVERTFDGIAMLIFMGVVGALIPLGGQLGMVFLVASIIFAVAVAAFLGLALARERSLRLLDLALRLLPARLRGPITTIIARFIEGLGVMQSARLVGMTLALSLGAWLCEAVMYALIAQSFGVGIGFLGYVLTVAVANLGSMIPSSPGYVGTFEAFALMVVQGVFGVDGNLAVGYIFVVHVALLLPVSALGFVYMWRYGLSLSSLTGRGARDQA